VKRNTFLQNGIMSLLLMFGSSAVITVHAESLVKGNAENGAAKAATCVACHGINGNSTNPEWPKIAGQSEVYLYQQMLQFKSGERKDPVMAAQVVNLEDQDMRDIAAYFSQQTQSLGAASSNESGNDLSEKAKMGERVYRAGNKEWKVTACIGCHGPRGLGNDAAAYPRVSGQHAAYTIKQLKAFKNQTRSGTTKAEMMADVATRLSDEEIEAVADYLQGLH